MGFYITMGAGSKRLITDKVRPSSHQLVSLSDALFAFLYEQEAIEY